MMKKLGLIIICIILFVTGLAAEDELETKKEEKAEKTIEKRIDIFSTQKMTITTFFEQLSNEYGVFFNFGDAVNTKQLIDVNLRNVSLNEAIYVISKQYSIQTEKITDKTYFVSKYEGKAETREEIQQTRIYRVKKGVSTLEETIKTIFKGLKTKIINEENIVVTANYNSIKQIDSFVEEFNQSMERKRDLMEGNYKLSYINPEEALKIINSKVKIEKSAVDTKNNLLLLTYDNSLKEEVENIIKLIDIEESSVLIEIMILDKYFSKEDNFGFEFNKEFTVTKNTGEINFNNFLPKTFEFNQTFANTKVLSQPKLLTTNKKTAEIHIGDRVPVIKGVTIIDKDSGDKERVPEIEYVNLGIILKVIPTVHNDEKISLDIKLEISSINGYTASEFGNFPVFNNKNLSSNIFLNSGDIIYLSGLISEDERKKTITVPILGNIPIVGNLFRKENNIPTQSEIIMAIRVKSDYYKSDNIVFDKESTYEENYKKYYENINRNILKRKNK